MDSTGQEFGYKEPSFEHRRSSELGTVEKNLQALSEFHKNPIENDIRISAYRQAMIEMLQGEDKIAIKALETLHEGNPETYSSSDTPNIYATNLYLRFLQKQLMHLENCPPGLRYPHDFTEAEAWKKGIRHIHSQKAAEAELIICSGLSIQSNVADRYKSLKLLLNCTEGRFTGGPLVLDIGSSQNLGLNVIAGNFRFFTETNIDYAGNESLSKDPVYLSNVMDMLGRQASIKQGIGVDMFTPDDPFIAAWIKACSLYPSELMNEELVAYYDLLAGFNSPLIDFVWNNYAEPWKHNPNRSTTELPQPGTVNVAVLSTILYQAPMEERKRILDRAYDSLSEDGLLLVQDFVVVDEQKSYELDFSPWHKRKGGETPVDRFPYKAFVWDKKNPSAGFQPFLSWSSGRCQTVRLEKYALKQLGIGI